MHKLAVLALLVPLAGCFGGPAACTLPDGTTGDDGPYATLVTDWGDIVVRLFADEAPLAVDNFVRLAHNDTYDGTLFWRMENDFIMQGGDPTGQGDGGWSATGEALPDEVTPERSHDRRGMLAMANRGPDTARSQFYITLGPAPSLDVIINENEHRGHTLFAEVIDGMDILSGLNFYAAGPSSGPDRGVPFHDVILFDVATACEDPTPAMRANLLTPGVWDVRADSDSVAAWVRGAEGPVDWDLVARDGLPESWRFTATPLESLDLPDGWQMALLSLNVQDAEPGIRAATLHAGSAEQPIQIRIAEQRGNVSSVADEVTIAYGMRHATFMQEANLQRPQIEVRVGTTSAVPGFAWGLIGIAEGERVVLHLPSAIAFGTGIPDDDPYKAFDGVDLDYNVFVEHITPFGS